MCKGCCETWLRDIQLANSVLYHIDERKMFEKIVNLAVEVFKKPGVEFLGFNRLKG